MYLDSRGHDPLFSRRQSGHVIPVGSIEFFRFMGYAHYPPCPPGGVYAVRGVMLHLEFL